MTQAVLSEYEIFLFEAETSSVHEESVEHGAIRSLIGTLQKAKERADTLRKGLKSDTPQRRCTLRVILMRIFWPGSVKNVLQVTGELSAIAYLANNNGRRQESFSAFDAGRRR